MRLNRRQTLAGAAALAAGALSGRATAQALSSFLPTAVIDAAFDMTSRAGMMDMLKDAE